MHLHYLVTRPRLIFGAYIELPAASGSLKYIDHHMWYWLLRISITVLSLNLYRVLTAQKRCRPVINLVPKRQLVRNSSKIWLKTRWPVWPEVRTVGKDYVSYLLHFPRSSSTRNRISASKVEVLRSAQLKVKENKTVCFPKLRAVDKAFPEDLPDITFRAHWKSYRYTIYHAKLRCTISTWSNVNLRQFALPNPGSSFQPWVFSNFSTYSSNSSSSIGS